MFFHVTSDHGCIGQLWWINAQPGERLLLADRHWELWGTFGIGRHNPHIALDPVND